MKFRLIILLIASGLALNALAAEVEMMRVTSDSVNVRIAPSVETKLLGQAYYGDEITAYEKSNGWVSVQAPNSLDFWVYGPLTKDGIVETDILTVRAAPERLRSNKVCSIYRGDFISERGETSGDWLKISPPDGCKVWINENYLEVVGTIDEAVNIAETPAAAFPVPAPVPEPVAIQVPAPAFSIAMPAPVSAPVAGTPELDNTRPQGIDSEVSGTLRRAGHKLYKLTAKKNGIEQAIYFVRGQVKELERYLNHPTFINGKTYWVKGVTLPVIQIYNIRLDTNIRN